MKKLLFMVYFQSLIHYLKRVITITQKDGFSRLLYIILLKSNYYTVYDLWIRNNEPTPKELLELSRLKSTYEPLISIVVPAYTIQVKSCVDMIESVINQFYSHWELCIALDNSTENCMNNLLQTYADKERRIKVHVHNNNRGRAETLNQSLSFASGAYITFLDQNDTLAPFALFELVKTINENPAADLFYSDEDTISEHGKKRSHPHFKPDWSPDLFRSFNFISHLVAISNRLMNDIGGFCEDNKRFHYYDLLLRATEKAQKIVHIPKVLYHTCEDLDPPSVQRPTLVERADPCAIAIADHLKRLNMNGTVEVGLFPGSYKVSYPIKDSPLVSIIIPNSNHANDLNKCVTSIFTRSTYKNFEIVIVDTNSSGSDILDLYEQLKKSPFVKILKWNNPFNYSKVNNYGVTHSSGKVLLFLNNDTEVITPDWIERLLEHAQRSEVGAVGAKLYYHDDTVQHGGIILGIEGIVGHAHRHFPRKSLGYMGRLCLVQNVSAVTGACLMTRKDLFEAVDGFDEDYPLTFSDVDYCLKLREKGFLVVWTPYAELYHDEFKTRGHDDTPEKKARFEEELALFRRKWPQVVAACDPYYNLNLTLAAEDFSLRIYER